jgi:hypothetical protein
MVAKDLEGTSKKPGDIFTVHFGDTFTTFKTVKFVPETRVVWQVVDCYLGWLSDKKEWDNTKIEWAFPVQRTRHESR